MSTEKNSKTKTSSASKSKSGKNTNNPNGAPAETTPTSSGGFIWLIVFVAIIGVGAWAFWPEIGPSIKPIISKVRGISTPEDFPAPKLANAPAITPAKITPSPDEIAEKSPVVEPVPTVTSPELSPATEQASETIRALEEIKQKLAAMEMRLQELESRPAPQAGTTSSAQVLVLATTQLAARLSGEGSFSAELDVLEKVSGQNEIVMDSIAKLRPHGDAGIPTVATLRARFVDVSRDVMRAHMGSGDSGWMGKVKDGIGSLITVRRTDPATTSDPVERALALADAALEVDALDEAVLALGAVEGAAGGALAPWLGDAGARLLAQNALDTLHNHALSQLGG